MKIIKPRHLGVLTNVYRWNENNFLGVSVITLLDMEKHPNLRDEKSLWGRVSNDLQLPDGIFDKAIPKHCAEFLVSGYCHPSPTHSQVAIQVEQLRKQFTVTTSNVAPFHPISMSDPIRQSLMGKGYDEYWMQHDYPGFARDTNWHVFNQAPSDQWWPESVSLPRGAAWRIENMHPTQPLLTGNLPLWQARSFVMHKIKDEFTFDELTMRATTVHFLPNCKELIIIWHGSCVVNEDDAFDVDCLMIALERDDVPRSNEHYRTILKARTTTTDSDLHSLNDRDLIDPEILKNEVSVSPNHTNGPFVENLIRYEQQQTRKINGDATKFSVENFRVEEDIAAQFARSEAEGKMYYKQMLKHHQQAVQLHDVTQTTITDGATQYHQQLKLLKSQCQFLSLSETKIKVLENVILDSYRQSAPHQKSTPRLSLIASHKHREELKISMLSDKDASGLDLTGADLSGMDLSGADLTNALMENTDLSNCILDNADLRGAILVRAECHHTSFKQCLFDGANLALGQFRHCDFSESSFKEVEMEDVQLEYCSFESTLLQQIFIRKAIIADCNFRLALINYCDLMDLVLSSIDFSLSEIRQFSLINCELSSVKFNSVEAHGLALVACEASTLIFDEAQLRHSIFTSHSKLTQTSFRRAILQECNFRDVDLRGSCLDEATLNDCDFSGADCRRSSLRLIRIQQSRFVRADLRGANFTGSSMIGADLHKSKLEGCDFSECNLFRADLSQTSIDNCTCFHNALTDGTKRVPHHP